MHRILAWIGDDSNQTNADLIQYHDPHLPKARINTIRLDSIYRIIRSRPNLCNSEQKTSRMILRHTKRSRCTTELMPNARRIRCNHKQSNLNERNMYPKEMKNFLDEKKELCDKNKGIHNEMPETSVLMQR
eukprot:CAMPEP_0201915308 /NCGR_PEP_ID=MMETSP0903-20130614/5252_1 /ASSEMBLY_ACC=CAM_ASM_000552 /TAXON_ID=420261 /ORGANISM="Thalassiosira antarctica, Strain CCMP982" /LENGTH=130 /DNA_ID=CAMNT_0048450881 /DNA_START=108 /DNA_END=500 /DNA_ORIENTATION=+